jgi:GH24 family phage-related lysozyme (muramidase)
MAEEIDPNLATDIGAAESDKLTAYKDSMGNWTVGRGHMLQPPDRDWTGYTITPAQDGAFFNGDVSSAVKFAQGLPEWNSLDTPCRENAVIELCFNMRGKWLTFAKCRAAIQAKNWQVAHDELLNSVWETEVHATRANRIANYLLTGTYPGAA